MSAKDLAVVIPTRDRWQVLGRTLDALNAQSTDIETIVVVDGEDQEIPPGVRGRSEIRLLVQEHAGPGVARNKAAEHTDRSLLLFLGDDMVAAPALVRRHLARHRQAPAPEVAVLGRVDWHPEIPRDRLMRWLDWSASQFDYVALGGVPADDVGFGRFYSCNVSLKRDLFLAVGGFDAEFIFDYEDLDLGWRLYQRGMRLAYEPAALAYHLHRPQWPAIERRYASRAQAERLMVAKHSWFQPWFHDRIVDHQAQPPASSLWPLIVDHVPRRPRRLHAWIQRRADRWYHQRLAPAFLAAWKESPG